MKTLTHLMTIALAAVAFLGIPLARFANPSLIAQKLAGTDEQAAIAASADADSGPCTILINRDRHPNPDELAALTAYLRGQGEPPASVPVDCVAFSGDMAGIKMANGLYEGYVNGQMTFRIADIVIGFSQADQGVFDVIVVSDQMYQIFTGDTVAANQNVEVVHR